MEKLIEGVHTFHETYYRDQRELFERLSLGQSPLALMVTCSDSRVVPNLITQSDPGELFTLRNAGNIVPAYGAAQGGEAATVEYAVEALGVEEIVVCGHSNCGAVKALMERKPLDGLPHVADWLAHARSLPDEVALRYPGASEGELLDRAIERNAVAQLENLLTYPSIARRVERGTLHLHAWVFDIGSGVVAEYDAERAEFRSLLARRAATGAGYAA